MTPVSTSKKCARCDAEVSAEALWGLCAKCLYDAADNPSMGAGAPSSPSRRFGDYELGEALGRGGMGVVYQAMQVSLHRPVALKMILESEASSPTSLRRFTLEAEAAAKLDHPNIVPIYEVGEHDGQPFLSMKLITGENLRKKIASGALCLTPKGNSANRAEFRERAIAIARMAATIARAVHHAHQNGVLHRDLKPANILVDRDAQPHVTDFGLAKMMDPGADEPTHSALTVSGTALGTPSYMSPEQGDGRRLTAASDIYSLGVILYEMLAGTPPFRGGTPLETLRLAAEQEAKRPSGINPRIDKDLDTICIKCLEKNPNARYRTAEAMAEDLERWLRQEPIHARPASLGLRLRRWVARNRVGAALIGSLCGGLALTLALLLQARARQEDLGRHQAHHVHRLVREVEEMWKDYGKPSVLIESSTLAELAYLPPRQPDPFAERLTVGLSINHEPIGQATQYSRFLSALERRMEKVMHRPVFIDLRLYKSEADAVRDAARDKLDVQRMSALTYVFSKQQAPGLAPVVRERSRKEAVIFASKASGITNLLQVTGQRVAFGQTNSTISFWAKVFLRRAGIRADHLRSFEHLSGTKPDREPNPAWPKGSEDRDSETQAHKRSIEAVSFGRADVGVAPRRQFENKRHRRGGLIELCAYPVTPDTYVSRPGLDTSLLLALRQGLLSFQSKEDKKLLAQLTQYVPIEGFDSITDDDFNDIRSAMHKEIAEFERGAPSQDPETPPARVR